MIEFLLQPWPWWFSGGVIALIMFVLLFFGKSFGFSSNLQTICSAAGAGRFASLFNTNWKSQRWNLAFLAGAVTGGWIAHHFLQQEEPVRISEATIAALREYGFSAPLGMQPDELYSWETVLTLRGFLILAVGGLMVGFGARYAGGCTSGHAISGLSDLQWPSLLAVKGFFLGGLVMTHVLFPVLF